MAKIVYKLNCISTGFDVGIVLSETEKTYEVVTVFKAGVYGARWRWKKSECFDSIELAQKAINERWLSKVELAENNLELCKSNAKKYKNWNVDASVFEKEIVDYINVNGINKI